MWTVLSFQNCAIVRTCVHFCAQSFTTTSKSENTMKVSVILPDDDALRFEHYCKSKGFKKSTLIVRLIREHIDNENFVVEQPLLLNEQGTEKYSEIQKSSR